MTYSIMAEVISVHVRLTLDIDHFSSCFPALYGTSSMSVIILQYRDTLCLRIVNRINVDG